MNEADILALTYCHTCIVKRPDFVNADGFDEYEEVEVYNNIPCAISYSGGSTEGESDTVQHIRYIATLFCRPELDIRAGDKVVATAQGKVRSYLCGEGVLYASHWEVPLIRETDA